MQDSYAFKMFVMEYFSSVKLEKAEPAKPGKMEKYYQKFACVSRNEPNLHVQM